MTARRQVLVSVVIIGTALAVLAAVSLRGNDGAVVEAEPQAHDHAAMAAAAGEVQPVTLDPESARRIGVTYATAMLRPFARTIATVGNVTFDETRLTDVSPKVEGWVERLYVDFTGAAVRRGQPLLEVYSPMLIAAQEELLLARRLADAAASAGGERATANARDLLESARRRLRYWDVSEEAIRGIEEAGTARRTLVLHAPASGVVIEKPAVNGGRVMPGMVLYRIADLSRVWIEGEIFEKDLSLVQVGQRASVTFEAYPGESFPATVTWVYPTVSVEARTGRIRLELANRDLRLKPGMYARVELVAEVDRSALMIPRSAVHFTGERSLVFLRGAGNVLTPREITTGLTAGADVVVLAGLVEGDVVVSSANFLIDAEANMGSSMAGMHGGASPADTTAGSGRDGH
jgi:Cu(I)/Ag(I) efflux system membrane fusion protein